MRYGAGSTGGVRCRMRRVIRLNGSCKIIAGFTLLLVGIVMLVTPGPGWVVILGGLAMLAAEFVWARRLLDRLKSGRRTAAANRNSILELEGLNRLLTSPIIFNLN